jgi:hypothetical protein
VATASDSFRTAVAHHIPIRLHWEGWDTDTYSLRRRGWSVLGDEGMDMNQDSKWFRIACTTPCNSVAMLAEFRLSGREMMFGGGRELVNYFDALRLEVRAVKVSDRVLVHGKHPWMASDTLTEFNGFATVPYEQIDLRSTKLFRKDEDAKNIYAPSGLVSECLDRILAVQFDGELSKIEAPKVTARIYGV